MAKKSMIERERRRIKQSSNPQNIARRKELKAKLISEDVSLDEQLEIIAKLDKMPKDRSPSRVTNRCQMCGRPHAVIKKFSLCRICLRNVFVQGYAPGLRKSSW